MRLTYAAVHATTSGEMSFIAPSMPVGFAPVAYGGNAAVPMYVDMAGSSGILPPPNGAFEAHERALIRQVQRQANPMTDAWANNLAEHGATTLWSDLAAQYRDSAGFFRGWLGTGLMWAAVGASALLTSRAKKHYARPRPYQVDATIQARVKPEKSASYPSGHTSAAYAAATVLSALWPQRSAEYFNYAGQVGASRIYGGVHYPTDVQVGARLGVKAATGLMRVLGF